MRFSPHADAPPPGCCVLQLEPKPIDIAPAMSVYIAAVNPGAMDCARRARPHRQPRYADVFDAGAPLALSGVGACSCIAEIVSPTAFYRSFNTGVGLTGMKLLWDGLR